MNENNISIFLNTEKCITLQLMHFRIEQYVEIYLFMSYLNNCKCKSK